MKYEINGKVVETDKELSEAEIDEIGQQIGQAPASEDGGNMPPPSGSIVDKLKGLASKAAPALAEGAELLTNPAGAIMSRVPDMAQRASNYVQGQPNQPAQTLLQAASNRPDITATAAASLMPGVGLAASAARVGGTAAAAALNPDNRTANAATAGGLQTALEALPYGAGKLAGLFKVGKAVAPAERAFAVQAAQEAKIPLTRAEVTGDRLSGGVESWLEKTFTGSQPINDFRQTGNTAFEEFKSLFKTKYGTSAAPTVVGGSVKQGIDSTIGQMKSQAQIIYDSLPSVKVQPAQLRTSAEDLLRVQYELPRANRDKGLIRMLNEYRKLGTKVQKSVDDNLRRVIYRRVENPKTYPTSTALQRVSSDLGDAWRKSVRTGETMGTVSGRDASILSDAIRRDIAAVGVLRTNLDAANKLWRQAKTLDKNTLIKRLRTAGPEEAVSIIFDGKRTTNAKLAKSALGPGYKSAKASYFSQLIDDPQLVSKLDKMPSEYLTSVFTADEITALRKTASIKRLRGAAEKMGAQYGSARTNTQSANAYGIVAPLAAAGTSLLHANIPGALAGLGAAAVAYKGPQLAARAYLTHGLTGINPAQHVPQTLPKTSAGLQILRQYLMNQQQNGPGSK